MYTQCTICRTWFRVEREQLHVARGMVRCGECGTVFNSLATLRHALPDGESESSGRQTEPDESDEEDPADGLLGRDAVQRVPSLSSQIGLLSELELEDLRSRHAVSWGWGVLVAVLVLCLVGQFVNASRVRIAQWPVVGTWVQGVYKDLGSPIPAPLDLRRFRLARTTLNSLPQEPSRLLLSSGLINEARHAQALPWLKLNMTNRFGKVVASRLLPPRRYMPSGTNVTVPAHSRLDFRVQVTDPGSNAVGYSLSLCRRSQGKVWCLPD